MSAMQDWTLTTRGKVVFTILWTVGLLGAMGLAGWIEGGGS